MNWTVFIDLAMEIAKNAPQLIADVEKLWADAQAAMKPSAEAPKETQHVAMASAIRQAKAASGDPQASPVKAQPTPRGEPAGQVHDNTTQAPKSPSPSPKAPQAQETIVGSGTVAPPDTDKERTT